jgi:hypothetical protein
LRSTTISISDAPAATANSISLRRVSNGKRPLGNPAATEIAMAQISHPLQSTIVHNDRQQNAVCHSFNIAIQYITLAALLCLAYPERDYSVKMHQKSIPEATGMFTFNPLNVLHACETMDGYTQTAPVCNFMGLEPVRFSNTLLEMGFAAFWQRRTTFDSQSSPKTQRTNCIIHHIKKR